MKHVTLDEQASKYASRAIRIDSLLSDCGVCHEVKGLKDLLEAVMSSGKEQVEG